LRQCYLDALVATLMQLDPDDMSKPVAVPIRRLAERYGKEYTSFCRALRVCEKEGIVVFTKVGDKRLISAHNSVEIRCVDRSAGTFTVLGTDVEFGYGKVLSLTNMVRVVRSKLEPPATLAETKGVNLEAPANATEPDAHKHDAVAIGAESLEVGVVMVTGDLISLRQPERLVLKPDTPVTDRVAQLERLLDQLNRASLAVQAQQFAIEQRRTAVCAALDVLRGESTY